MNIPSKSCSFAFVLLFGFGSARAQDSPEDVAVMHSGLEALESLALDRPEIDPDELMKRLGVGLMKTSHGRIYRIPGREDIYKLLQKTMMSIPGHAEFYDRRIRGEWEAFQEAWERDPEKADASRFLNGVRYDFPVLEHLPSAENVRVLGEMILEPEKYLTGPEIPNVWLAGKAVLCLHALPLVNKPVAGERLMLEADVETYRLWYSQIKAGTRTFGFDGDPNEYDLNGVVKAGAVEAETVRARIGSEVEIAEGVEDGTPWQGVLVGLGLVVVAGGYWLWGRRGK